jgi:hypothetical protein
MEILSELCNILNAENATRAHSTVDRQLIELFGAAAAREFFVTTGDVETRLRERGCKGVMGVELDRRRALRVAVLTNSPSGCRFEGVCGTGFAASPNALRAALTICVASAPFSLAESSPGSVGLGLFDSPFTVPFAVVLPDLAALVTRASDDGPPAEEPSFGRSSALSVTVVAGEQVETLDTALLTASTCACVEAI